MPAKARKKNDEKRESRAEVTKGEEEEEEEEEEGEGKVGKEESLCLLIPPIKTLGLREWTHRRCHPCETVR